MAHSFTPHRESRGRSTLWTRALGRALLPLLLIITVLANGLAGPARAASDQTRVLPQLQNEAAARPQDDFRVVVTRVNRNPEAENHLKRLGGNKVKEIGGESFVATIKGNAIARLGKNPAVKWVTPDAKMRKTAIVDSSKLATLYPQVVKASGLWSGATPITGAGIGVAILDTGINTGRAEWKDATGASRIATSVKFNSNTNSGSDGHGHGTHVAGIVGGNSWFDSGRAGKYIGIAPEARIINVKVSDDAGMSYLSDVVSAIDWAVANRATYNIRVMNLSLVSSVAESYTTSVLAAAVERAWLHGIFVVVAAGNAGPDTLQYPPANDPFVVTVGAADSMGTVGMSDDTVASWSSYGTTQDLFSKPDVVAPGRYITSMSASTNTTLAKAFPDRIVDNTYLWLSGTSMAAPVVAGVAALAFQAHPEWTNDQVKWLLMNTATKLGTTTTTFTPHPGQGAGEVSAEAVVRYNLTPSYANQGLTVSPLLVSSDGSIMYSADSTASWSTASWSTASWSAADETDVE